MLINNSTIWAAPEAPPVTNEPNSGLDGEQKTQIPKANKTAEIIVANNVAIYSRVIFNQMWLYKNDDILLCNVLFLAIICYQTQIFYQKIFIFKQYLLKW